MEDKIMTNRHSIIQRTGTNHRPAVACILALLAACAPTNDSEAVRGSLRVLVEPETTITRGVSAGEERGQIADGWSATFSKYLVAVGDLDMHLSTDKAVDRASDKSFVVDLVKLPEDGLELWMFDDMQSGDWEFNYWTTGAAHGASRHSGVEVADFDHMVDSDLTYLIEGSLTKEGGESCPPVSLLSGQGEATGNTSGGNECYAREELKFRIEVSAETRFGPCGVDGDPGFSISADATRTVAISIHGDHLFFNGFPSGDEGGITRLAQWLADCDLDLNGTVSSEELQQIDPALLPEFDERYGTGTSPIKPLDNMLTYLKAQLKTQGHFQGEGECPVDGEAHEHSHDEHSEEEHSEDEHSEEEHSEEEHSEEEHSEDEHSEEEHSEEEHSEEEHSEEEHSEEEHSEEEHSEEEHSEEESSEEEHDAPQGN